MSNVFRIKRRMTGAAGSPGETGFQVGEVIVNAQDATNPELWFFGGPTGGTAPNNKGFLRLNPKTTITTQSISLVGSAGADIGAAYTAWATTPANVITGNVVIATWGTPAQAYVLTNSAAPGTAASWTSLGGAVAFANATEIHTGTDTTKAINSSVLRGETRSAPTNVTNLSVDEGRIPRLNASGVLDPHFIPQPAPAGAGGVGGDVATVIAGVAVNMFLTPAGLEMRVAHTPNATPANDVNKLPALDATGKIPAAFLPAGGLQFTGNKDLTVPYVAPAAGAGPKNGDLAFVSKAGAVDPSWNAVLVNPPATVGVGDMLVYEGGTVNKWHITASDVDVSGYVPKDGVTTMGATARMNFAAAAPATGAAPGVIIDGGANMGSIDNCVWDCGTF